MSVRIAGALLALAIGIGVGAPASADERPTIAIMPCGYFSADPLSAWALTNGLVEAYEHQGYRVLDMSWSRKRFRALGLSLDRHYPDSVALDFGRGMRADLVAYPRLLAVGIPASVGEPSTAPEAVVHLRVLNTHTRQPIYFRQVGHAFSASAGFAGAFWLPQPIATAAANDATSMYFQQVAGSREEYRGAR